MEAPQGTNARSVRWQAWTCACAVISFPGAVFACWAVPVSLLALAAALPPIVTAMFYGLTSPTAGRPPGARPRLAGRWWAALAASISVIGVALLGLGALSGPAVPLAIGLAALTSPPALDARKGHRHHPAGSGDPAAADRRAALAPQGMSTAQLCAAWRHTFGQLQRARTTSERARLVSLRQSYLDEMESRDAAGLSAWLASGAQASGGPDKFLRSRPDAA